MYKLKKKLVSWVLLVIVTLGTFGQSIPLAHASNVELTNATITNYTIEHGDTSTGDTFNYWETFKLNVAWDASMYENKVQSGDYFTVQLPDTLKFPQNSAAKEFDITDAQNNIVAHGQVSPLANGGGSVKVVFTNYVENKYNIKGTMAIASEFNNSKVKHGALNQFDISSNGQVSSASVNVSQIGVDPGEIFYKWSSRLDNPNEAEWTIRLNYSKGNSYSNLKISDELFAYTGSLSGIHYVDGSFLLRKVKVSPVGGIEEVYETKNISKDIQFNADKTSFTYDFGKLEANDQYVIDYKTTYVAGVQLRNKATFKSDTLTTETYAHYEDASSSGTGQGDTLGEIKIIKVDSENDQKRLENATFKVTKLADNTSVNVTTDSNGEASLSKLIPGEYKVEEVKAPEGYKLDTTPRVIKVTSGVVSIQKFVNAQPMGKIEVVKQDKVSQGKLAGAEFDVKDAKGTVVDHIVTDATGTAKTKNLVVGSYTLVETKAPTGYVLNQTPQTAVVTENGNTVLTFVNEKCQPEKGRIKVRKYDARCGYPLVGAEFVVTDASGKVVATLVTNFFGEATVELPVGNYQVKETKAPAGYVLNQTPQSAAVTKNGNAVLTFVNEKCQPEKGIIKVKKYDARCGYELAGAEFAVVDASGKVVATLVTNQCGEAVVELPVGNYIVKETKAPKGYQLEKSSVTVSVVKGKTTKVTFYNKRINDCEYVYNWNNCYNYYYTMSSTNCYYYLYVC